MAKINVTNRTLLLYDQEVKGFAGSILYHFFQSKIKEFYNNNHIKISSIRQKQTAINKAYLIYDGVNVKTEGEGDAMNPVFIEGKSKEDYNNEMKALFDTENVFEI